MSADNWAVCPRCKRRHDAAISAEAVAIAASYGQVPVDEFDAMRSALADKMNDDLEPTYREDWEINGTADGELFIDYHGGCAVCGLTMKFRHTEPLAIDDTNA